MLSTNSALVFSEHLPIHDSTSQNFLTEFLTWKCSSSKRAMNSETWQVSPIGRWHQHVTSVLNFTDKNFVKSQLKAKGRVPLPSWQELVQSLKKTSEQGHNAFVYIKSFSFNKTTVSDVSSGFWYRGCYRRPNSSVPQKIKIKKTSLLELKMTGECLKCLFQQCRNIKLRFFRPLPQPPPWGEGGGASRDIKTSEFRY